MLKELEEKRGAVLKEMNEIIGKAKEEKRSITPEETARFNELDSEYKNLEATIRAEERAVQLCSEERAVSAEKCSAESVIADYGRGDNRNCY